MVKTKKRKKRGIKRVKFHSPNLAKQYYCTKNYLNFYYGFFGGIVPSSTPSITIGSVVVVVIRILSPSLENNPSFCLTPMPLALLTVQTEKTQETI